jgi:cytochrome c biogenesis protein CcmG, thiol:disulfide interchange protein DsbE
MRAAAILAAVVLLLSGCSASKEGGATAVTRLPDATLQPLGDGRPVDLGELRGPMVVNLWASWCGPCREELPRYQAFSEKYAGKVAVLGVDWQDTRLDKAKALIRRTGVTYPLVTDPKGTLRNKYLPKLILIDADGKVAYQEYVKITSVAQLETLVAKHLGVSAS